MGLILGIETATEVCSVAVFKNGNALGHKSIQEGNMHASALTGLISDVITEVGLSLMDLDAVCVSKGPGSYTGLRVGVSTAKGLCYALSKPLISVGTLESMAGYYAQQHPNNQRFICPMIDARRMEVYTALFSANARETIQQATALIIDETSFRQQAADTAITFIGNGAAKCMGVIQHPNVSFEPAFSCSALGLGIPAQNKWESGQFEDLAYFEPYYLKDFVGTTPRKK